MAYKIMITGSAGTVGSEVVKHLLGRGLSLKIGLHHEEKFEHFDSHQERLQPVEIDFNNPKSLKKGFKGVERLFLLTPGISETPEMVQNAVEAAMYNGVRYIVRLSVMHAGKKPGIILTDVHKECEDIIESSGIPFTSIRPNSFMQNFTDYHLDEIKMNNTIHQNTGDGKASYVDARDLGEVIARIIAEKQGHEGKAYVITGPQALSVGEVAQIFSKVSTRDIQFVNVTDDQMRDSMLKIGMSEEMTDAVLQWYQLQKKGELEMVTPLIKQLTGRNPMTFDQFAMDHMHMLRKQGEKVYSGMMM